MQGEDHRNGGGQFVWCSGSGFCVFRYSKHGVKGKKRDLDISPVRATPNKESVSQFNHTFPQLSFIMFFLLAAILVFQREVLLLSPF